ncbi:L-arabinose isomerase [Clostridia bacterium]|nr:L-arabinose isomerase [Clostridia bacterium]
MKKNLKENQFWFVAGSQNMYGPEVLVAVSEHAAEMVEVLNKAPSIPGEVIYKATAKTNEEIKDLIKEANYEDRCTGVIVWMHTFSPSKMWINGLALLQKPYLHLHTQYNRNIPGGIDMDFMNLNQAAHGDREHGFITARLRLPRKIVVGYWQDDAVQEKIGSWMRSAIGASVSRNLKVVRFGDNMRHVAVTEGDKVEAQIKLGWQVNTQAVGALVSEMDAVTDTEIDALMDEYRENYSFATDDTSAVRIQAREEIAIRRVLEREGASAFTNTFEDLTGMKQLPGLASQRLLEQGYGYGGEGDWKVSAMTHIIKEMTQGMPGGTGFMEDYTYDLEPGNEMSLGAHMLEVCPTLAADKPRIEVHPLGIGGKEPPARLVFEGKAGKAILASIIDMGGRLRLIVHDVEAVKPIFEMPDLPVARVMWKATPDLLTGSHAWILCGGAHHAVFSYDATAEMLEDWAEIMDVEFVHIHKDTTIEGLKQQLFLSDIAWKLR